jgi:hypothetical protein
MKKILQGDFAKFRRSLDLAEVQGSYSENVEEVRSSGEANPLIRTMRVIGSTRISWIGVS